MVYSGRFRRVYPFTKLQSPILGTDNMDSLVDNMENSSIRVDTATKKGSVIDVARMVLGCTSSVANTYLGRLKAEASKLDTESSHPLDRCTQLRINGKGKLTPVADAKTLIEIIFLLPGQKASGFRRKGAKYVCRVVGGDMSLVTEAPDPIPWTSDTRKYILGAGRRHHRRSHQD